MLKITPLDEFSPSWRQPVQPYSKDIIPSVVLEWAQAHETFWVLRLCERFGTRTEMWDYPPAGKWNRRKDSLYYSGQSPATDPAIQGRCATKLSSDKNALHFEATLKNDSAQTWQDAWGWVCLMHLWAGAFQANCELPTETGENPWQHCASLPAPMERWLKWCPVHKKKDMAERIGLNQKKMWQPHIEANQGSVRAWQIDAKRSVQQIIQMVSPDAVILGWSHWPCTDMGLYFGDLTPGSSAKVQGDLIFHEKPFKPL